MKDARGREQRAALAEKQAMAAMTDKALTLEQEVKDCRDELAVTTGRLQDCQRLIRSLQESDVRLREELRVRRRALQVALSVRFEARVD